MLRKEVEKNTEIGQQVKDIIDKVNLFLIRLY